MTPDYPVTPTQKETALRRGWTCTTSGRWKKEKWVPPKNFTQGDERRIAAAASRRFARARGAD